MGRAKLKVDISKGYGPDLTESEAVARGFLLKCENVVPINGKYYPVNQPINYIAGTYSGTAKGVYSFRDASNNPTNILGTTTHLYTWAKSGITDVSRVSGGAYTNSTSWRFALYGEWVVATNYADDIQVYKPSVGDFAALTGTTSPSIKAKYCLMNHTHLVIADLNEASTINHKKVRWSARDNIESWTASLSTGAGSQSLPDIKGNITGLAPVGDNFAVFAEDSITLGYFMGGQFTFGFKINQIQDIGCYFPGSLVSTGSVCFFWSRDNIYMYDGTSIKPIGDNVRSTLFSEVSIVDINNVNATHDKENGLIMWGYTVTGGSSPSKILVYSYKEDKFTTINMNHEVIGFSYTGGFVINDITSLIDSVSILVNSDYWTSGDLSLIIFNSSNIKTTVGGSANTCVFKTGDLAEEPNVIRVLRVYNPMVMTQSAGPTGNLATLTMTQKYGLSDTTTTEAALNIKSYTLSRFAEWYDVRCTGKKLSMQLDVSSQVLRWCYGVLEYEGSKVGGR